jgi:hypothetical protein
MAVLHRTKEPAVTDDPTVQQDQAVTDEAPPTEPVAGAAPATTATTRTQRRGLRRRREPGGPGVGLMAASAGAGAIAMLARVIRFVAGIVALIIALGIAFVALKASPSNTIVSHIHDWGNWLTTPFHNMFHVHGARGTLALNWGIAILVYLAAAWLITRMLLAPWRAVRRRTTATA